jgi:UDP-glucose 4-epimerase
MLEVRRAAVLGAGFIGRELVRELLSLDCETNVLDHNVCPEEFIGKTRWLTGDFADSFRLRQVLEGVQLAFHLVSSTVPGDDTADPIAELSDNVFATLNFLAMCREVGVKRVAFVSSASVYGLQERTPIGEGATTNPISSHGIQKLLIEKYLLLHRFHHGLDVRIVRLANPYGPEQKTAGRQGFIALALGHWLNHRPILLRDGGRPIRDFIYVGDVARALAQAGIRGNVPAILNIGFGMGHSLKAVVDQLADLLGSRPETCLADPRGVDIPTSVLDISMARETLGFEPRYSLRAGLIETLRSHGISPLVTELR